MPPDFIEEIFRAQIQKLRGPPNCSDKGFAAPLNIFLFQEHVFLVFLPELLFLRFFTLSWGICWAQTAEDQCGRALAGQGVQADGVGAL